MLNDRDKDLLFGHDTARPGDVVVHFEHGLATYEGDEVCALGDEEQRLVSLMYRDGGKLMLPAKEGQDFWRYGADVEAVTLDRLNAGDWQTRRDELVQELRDCAETLIAEDAARRAERAIPLEPLSKDMKAFAQGFVYDLTADQSTAIAACLEDLTDTEPMNRLLIGDVGFGKTEVALRVAAAAVFSGQQVILAAPTTVLARQHFETVEARFEGTGICIAEISRATTDAELRVLNKALRSGKVQIVVTTQAILTADLRFPDLALLIIDEEQKFGVQQKVDLRAFKPGLHVLTMTATPIPRSLAMAEVGLLDVSVIATAPKDRLPIATRVRNGSAEIMIAAIRKELARDGQCYVICPRISGIEDVRAMFDAAELDFSYSVAHGKMADNDCETAMLHFMGGDVDVLLSTSIVESGLDNTQANTMVIWHAEQFGLSQLHQLRGRIGRSKLPAHMVLLSEIELDVAGEAQRRLSSFAEMSEIGAGFRIARKDRDLRGFGELDGDEQSGHHSQLGIGLYRHILKTYVCQISNGSAT